MSNSNEEFWCGITSGLDGEYETKDFNGGILRIDKKAFGNIDSFRVIHKSKWFPNGKGTFPEWLPIKKSIVSEWWSVRIGLKAYDPASFTAWEKDVKLKAKGKLGYKVNIYRAQMDCHEIINGIYTITFKVLKREGKPVFKFKRPRICANCVWFKRVDGDAFGNCNCRNFNIPDSYRLLGPEGINSTSKRKCKFWEGTE